MNEPNPRRRYKASASYKRAIIFGVGSGLAPQGWSEPCDASVRCLSLSVANPDQADFTQAVWATPLANSVVLALSALALLLLILMLRTLYHRGCLRAVLAERERLELDLHDTLAQSFAGIGFQLQAIRREIPQDLHNLERQVDLARDLLLHSRKEALRTVSSRDTMSNERFDLLRALELSARTMADGGTLAITASIAGEQRPLRATVATALLRIGQEAIANVIRHAYATHLVISLFYTETAVTLSVTDNGTGFVERGDLLGFGLRGMRKRAAAVSASFEVSSTPGDGTHVSVVVLSQPPFRFARIRNTLRHSLWKGPIHAHAEE